MVKDVFSRWGQTLMSEVFRKRSDFPPNPPAQIHYAYRRPIASSFNQGALPRPFLVHTPGRAFLFVRGYAAYLRPLKPTRRIATDLVVSILFEV